MCNSPTADTKLTPYQGKLKTFGFFNCVACKRTWGSAHSWANTAQKCFTCKNLIYPHVQMRRRRRKNKKKKDKKENALSGHQKDLCQMCTTIKANCEHLTIKMASLKL